MVRKTEDDGSDLRIDVLMLWKWLEKGMGGEGRMVGKEGGRRCSDAAEVAGKVGKGGRGYADAAEVVGGRIYADAVEVARERKAIGEGGTDDIFTTK